LHRNKNVAESSFHSAKMHARFHSFVALIGSCSAGNSLS
jgi:hypothetical protein